MKRHGIFLAAALGLCALAQAEVINITQGSTTGYTMTDGNTYVIQKSVCFSNSIAGGNGMSANGRDSVMECYIAGLVPTNAEEVFRTVISWKDGAPQISWEPKLDAIEEAKRTYTIYGRESLTTGSWGPTNANSRFFRVKVAMP